LEGQLASLRAQLDSLRGFLSEDAPSVRILKSQINAAEQQLADQRQRLGGGEIVANPAAGSDNTLTSRVGTYEDLAVDLQFLQQAYVTALASREAARLEADRAQRYLAAFVKPATPQSATYPKRLQNILIFAGFAVMLWGIGVMIVYIIREHSS
jgi:capsular polysaccharide transport system permease protein